MALPKPLKGIVPPIATPLLRRDELDCSSVERLVHRMVEAGVHGLFALGTTGEGASLSRELRSEFVQVVCSAVAGRVPVLVNVSDPAVGETVSMAEGAARSGASGLVIAPPYYMPLSQSELLRYLKEITPELPLPVYLYNYPEIMKTPIAPATVAAALELPNLYGIKDSSSDIDYITEVIQLCAHRPDFSILTGSEQLLARAIALGAHGGVTGGANLWPELYLDLYQAALHDERKRIEQLEGIVANMSVHVYNLTKEASSYIRGLKCALALSGLCRNVLAEPLEAYRSKEAVAIRAALIANRVPLFYPPLANID